MSRIEVSRRRLLQTAAVAGTAAVSGGVAPSAVLAAATDATAAGKATIVARDNSNIVETVYGKVRGSERSGIHIFRGIPYGADTGGKNRFLPARKAEPWAGVRSALWYEHVCPSDLTRAGWNHDEEVFLFQWDDGKPGEDCLRVNIWTPGINDNRKRPVMVWVHGGGFDGESAQELRCLDGEALCRRGDVVVVSFNHRLNVFGFLNLSDIAGPDYATSGNVGMTDIVFVLQWIRDNIANFGGDPANVTIMGQSGGGAKVSTLLAMPSAKGLYQKASIHSGSMLHIGNQEHSLRLSKTVLEILNISASNLGQLQTISTDQLLNAGIEAQRRHTTDSEDPFAPASQLQPPPPWYVPRLLGWSPSVDGNVLPNQTFEPVAPSLTADVPLMVGTALNEFWTAINQPNAFSMTDEQAVEQLTKTYGSRARELFETFRKGHAKANPYQLWSIISAGSFRDTAVTQAQRKAALGKAAAYNFWFQWQTPVLDGRPMAFHCSDLSFFFDNMERCETMTGNGPEARALSAQMSEAWIAFARTGNPNHPGIPKWSPVTPTGSQTMIFDAPTHFSEDPDSEERNLLNSLNA